ncbi:endonuclease [Candidatus Gracilibacteria bacterium]|nr:MAG: endonuclease [Candidatus Gracilibacteria bacterium]
MYTLYILRCRDGSLYTGITTDIDRRIKEHNGERKGGAKYTRGRHPVSLVYSENFVNRSEASKREREIKQMTVKEKRKLIQ